MAESFRFRYDFAMMSVQEYAQEAKVSERSVRARLERGMLQGRKLGSRWVVDALPAAHHSHAGRPISFDAFNALARYCDGQSSVLSAEERRRAKERASAIQVQGPASVERYRARRGLKVHHLQAPPAEIPAILEDPALSLTGISSDISQVYGSMVDAYVSSQDLENIIFLYNLLPGSGYSGVPDHYFHAAVVLDCERYWCRLRGVHFHSPGAGPRQGSSLADVPGLRGVRNLLRYGHH